MQFNDYINLFPYTGISLPTRVKPASYMTDWLTLRV